MRRRISCCRSARLPMRPAATSSCRGTTRTRFSVTAGRLGARFGAPGYLRYLFGLPVNEALLSGYQITQRALRETTPHACAQEIARTALEVLPDPGPRGHAGEAPSVLDLFAGVGQMAYSYAKSRLPCPGRRQRPHHGRRRHAQHGAGRRDRQCRVPPGRWPGDAGRRRRGRPGILRRSSRSALARHLQIRPGPAIHARCPRRRHTGTRPPGPRARPPRRAEPAAHCLPSQIGELAARARCQALIQHLYISPIFPPRSARHPPTSSAGQPPAPQRPPATRNAARIWPSTDITTAPGRLRPGQ